MGRYAMFNGLVYGGGTAVIPNPEGTPTDELHSIQIDEDIYEIVGGGGSGEGYSETLLYKYENGTTVDGIKTLNDDITNYDLLLFRLVFNVPTYTDHIISVSALEQVGYISNPVATGPHVSIVSYASDYIRIVEGETKNKINIFEINGNEYIDEIYGIKLEVGDGSQELISYDTTITTTQYGWWTAEDKNGNVLDPDQYELIAVTPLVNNSPSWVGSWDGAFYINSVDGVTHRYDVTFVNINDGGYIRTSRTWDIKVVYRDKNAAGGGGGSTVVPNPQEEPTDTLNTVEIDGVVYNIEGGSEGEGVEIYSEDEYIVGKWIDGKKIYQKTLHLSNIAIPSGTSTIKYTDDSIEYAWVEKGIFREGRTDTAIPSVITNLTFSQSDSARFGVGIDDVNRNYIKFFASDNFSANVNRHFYITIRYTKTVETPAPAWGGSVTNNYANFIDTDNVIDSGTYTGTFTYTATEDCYVNVALINNSNDDAQITIDGAIINYTWSSNGITNYQTLPLKKGQTLVATSSAGSSLDYTVYGITYASGSSDSGSSKIEYSTEEKEVGTWIDGSKVYELTIFNDNLTDTSTVPNAMYIGSIPNNANIVTELSVSVCDSNHAGWVTGGGICTVNGWNFGLHITQGKVVLYGGNVSAIQGGMAIAKIRYTKTTI